MRKILLYTVTVATLLMYGCREEEGTKPGSDGYPNVTIYQYQPAPPCDADMDVIVRFASNNKTKEFYYLPELLDVKESFITTNDEEAYIDHVISNGTKIEVKDLDTDYETTLTGLAGLYSISAVAIAADGSKRLSASIFEGVAWEDWANGTYTSTHFAESWEHVLQKDADSNLFRFKNLYTEGYHFVFEWDIDEKEISIMPQGPAYTVGGVPVILQSTGVLTDDGTVVLFTNYDENYTFYDPTDKYFQFESAVGLQTDAGFAVLAWIDEYYEIDTFLQGDPWE